MSSASLSIEQQNMVVFAGMAAGGLIWVAIFCGSLIKYRRRNEPSMSTFFQLLGAGLILITLVSPVVAMMVPYLNVGPVGTVIFLLQSALTTLGGGLFAIGFVAEANKSHNRLSKPNQSASSN